MGEFEQLLGDLGAKQWVKNKFITKLRDFQTEGNKDVDKFVAEFNQDILQDFKVVAQEAVNEVINKASELLAPKD